MPIISNGSDGSISGQISTKASSTTNRINPVKNRGEQNKSFTFEYDHNGNIIYKGEYPFSLKLLNGGEVTSFNYIGDKLQNNCEYDALGNPVVYNGKNLTWGNLRNLVQYGNIDFDYDASGIRTNKVNDENHEIIKTNLLKTNKKAELFYSAFLKTS